MPFINFSPDEMKTLIEEFIKKQIDELVGPNAFSAGIDATKVVQGVRLSQRYKAIVGGIRPNHFISISTMSEEYLQDRIDAMRSKDKKS